MGGGALVLLGFLGLIYFPRSIQSGSVDLNDQLMSLLDGTPVKGITRFPLTEAAGRDQQPTNGEWKMNHRKFSSQSAE